MKIALAQVNTSMGNIDANTKKISEMLSQSKKIGADLTIFPELALIGYPPTDLIFQNDFVDQTLRALETLAQKHSDQSFIVGFVESHENKGKGFYNSAAFVHEGAVKHVQRKSLLPTYDIFDEHRYFDSGDSFRPIEFMNHKIGLTICEDMWFDESVEGKALYAENILEKFSSQSIDLMINISASPYHAGKENIRRRVMKRWAQELNVPFVFVNLVGGNDDIIFDGGSMVLSEKGESFVTGRVFEEDLKVYEFNSEKNSVVESWPENREVWLAKALTLGLKDFVHKCGFKDVVLGLSGGIDSALTTLLAVEALGKEHVMAVMMPSPYNSPLSLTDSQKMVDVLGIEHVIVPIEACMKSYDNVLAPSFKSMPKDVTEENIQARIRGNILMAISNKFKKLVLSTGNKSELAVGYCTQYGDMAGGLAPIADLYKGDVYKLTAYLNRKYMAVPENIFTRAPSAELRPNQTDQDSLPDYETLDAILKHYLEARLSGAEIIQQGFDAKVVGKIIDMVGKSEFKRKQAAPGLRVSEKAFGRGRRMPLARGSV